MQQAQDINTLIFGLTEHHEVTPSSALPSHVQCADTWPDVVSRPSTWQFWSVMQGLDGQGQRLSVSLSLALSKIFECPLS
jgi:hypothetical protein